MVHSLNRWPSQRRTLDPLGIGRGGACTFERNTAILVIGSATPERRISQDDWPRRYGLPNNPLTAFHSVRAGLGGPARATRTGTLDRFKMSRVKSPMI